jgi:HK97 family phage major capsid protein
MSTPTPTSVTTGGFGGYPFPPDVVARVINLLISGAPFADSLTRQPTGRSVVAWPTAKPSGFSWLNELQPFPTINLGDDAYVVGVAKLGGIVDMSNESVSDNSINLSGELATLLRDSLSRDLDLGLLFGDAPPEPIGAVGIAPEVTGADLLEAVTTARGQIGDAGGSASHIAALPSVLANADAERDSNGQLVFPAGFAASAGLLAVGVPGLTSPLVYDKSRAFLVVRDDAAVDASTDWHFHLDAYSLRVKARMALAVPDVPKTIRKLAVGDGRARAKPAAKS